MLTTRLLVDASATADIDDESACHHMRSILLDWKVLFYMFIYLGVLTSLYSFNILLPVIVKDVSSNNATMELFTVPPYIVSCLTTIIFSANADYVNERSGHIMVLLFIEIIGFLYFIQGQSYSYVGAIIVGVGVFSSNALVLSWVASNIGGRTRRAMTLAVISAFGHIGAIFSELIYHTSSVHYYDKKHYIIVGTVCFTLILVLLLRLLLQHENKRKCSDKTAQVQGTTTTDENQPLLDRVNLFIRRKYIKSSIFSALVLFM